MARSRLLAVPLLVLASMAASAQAARGRSLAEQVDLVLEGVSRPAQAGQGANQLARLGEGALVPLFTRLGAGEVSVARRAAILGALAQMPVEQVLGLLAEVARGTPGEPERLAGLDLLARFGAGSALPLAFELGRSSEADAPPSPELRRALEGALSGILVRQPGAARILADSFARVSPAARASITGVLARSGVGATSALADLLGRADGDADTVILLELGASSRKHLPRFDALVSERVRTYLAHPDPALVVLAATACAALADDAAIPDLIVLLEDQRANVRTVTHAALLTLTGTNLAADAQGWLTWFDEGLAWWNEGADPCRTAIVNGTASEAAAALREVARQRLFVREIVPLLQLAARRPEPALAHSACRALAALPERVAREALLDLALLPEPGLAETARAALARIPEARPAAPRHRSSLPHLRPMP